ncbi:MAG TPA: hypothetical protein VG711_11435, partial [Phycisphaerales bacterium]|nr:hypothetical protein [Phycisphaerales bacterium]
YQAGYTSCASGVRGAHPPLVRTSEQVTSQAIGNHRCILRDHVVAAWGAGQAEYLLAKNAREMNGKCGEWPAEWVG